MSSTTSTTSTTSNKPAAKTPPRDVTVLDDAQLLASLEHALDAAVAELAEVSERREALATRVESLANTVAVFKGETPAAKRAPKRRAKRPARHDVPDVDTSGMTVREARAAKKAAKEAAAAAEAS